MVHDPIDLHPDYKLLLTFLNLKNRQHLNLPPKNQPLPHLQVTLLSLLFDAFPVTSIFFELNLNI